VNSFKWEVANWKPFIARCELVSETAAFATVVKKGWGGKPHTVRMKKADNLFDSFEKAQAFLMGECDAEMRAAEAKMQRAKQKKQEINNLKDVE